MQISLATQIKDRNCLLEQSLPTWLIHPFHEIVIVDQPGKERAFDVVSNYLSDPRIKLIECIDTIPYRVCIGRNTAIRNTESTFVLHVDSDVKILDGFSIDSFKENFYYHHVPISNWGPLGGCILMARKDFNTLNGYNERMLGWGYDDDDICIRLNELGIKSQHLPPYFFHIDHGDDLRTQSYAEKSTAVMWNSNKNISIENKWTLQDKQQLLRCNVYQKNSLSELVL
jgi:glycosyltransferase involved in cell wall biosynthesis